MLHVNRRDLYGEHYQTSFEMLKEADVRGLFATAFPLPEDADHFSRKTYVLIEKDFKEYNNFVEQNSEWDIVRTSADTLQIGVDDKHYLILHVEGLNAFEGAPEDWAMLDRWKDELHWRSLGLVWNKTNKLGGGTEDGEQTLTPLGREMVVWLEENKMVLDCAHMNEPTFWDVHKLTERPMLVSHGNARVLCDSPRNLTDAQLRAVGQSEGVAGIFCSARFISHEDKVGLDHVFDQVDHMHNVLGEDGVALGTDFGGITSGCPHGFDGVDKIHLLFEEMQKRGYSERTIQKIAFDNAYRVVNNHLEN